MTAKQYLQTYRRLEGRYNAAVEEMKSIDNNLISLKSPNFEERVKCSPKNDPIGEMVIALEKEKGKLGVNITLYRTKMILIKNQIMEMDNVDNDYYVILLLRYILYKDWKFICDNLNLSRAQANIVHGRALKEFDVKFGANYAEK
nr:MAG TPA: Protein of unknown function (DUF1492) [Caudoviricetes sp.]